MAENLPLCFVCHFLSRTQPLRLSKNALVECLITYVLNADLPETLGSMLQSFVAEHALDFVGRHSNHHVLAGLSAIGLCYKRISVRFVMFTGILAVQ
jgi:hypothetical protein